MMSDLKLMKIDEIKKNEKIQARKNSKTENVKNLSFSQLNFKDEKLYSSSSSDKLLPCAAVHTAVKY